MMQFAIFLQIYILKKVIKVVKLLTGQKRRAPTIQRPVPMENPVIFTSIAKCLMQLDPKLAHFSYPVGPKVPGF